VDYLSAYTQAPLDCELFLSINPGFTVHDGKLISLHPVQKGNSIDWLPRSRKNMNGLKQAGNNWFNKLNTLFSIKFSSKLYRPMPFYMQQLYHHCLC
jgi:hypothetical protein